MVVWLFRGFFLLLAAAVVVWLIDTIRNQSQTVQQAVAMVERKAWTSFPWTVISIRWDRKDCTITFSLPDEGRVLSLSVPEDVFQALQKEETGILTYQGTRFRSFARADGSVVCHTALSGRDEFSKE